MRVFNLLGIYQSFKLDGDLYVVREWFHFSIKDILTTIIFESSSLVKINGPLWSLIIEWWIYFLALVFVGVFYVKPENWTPFAPNGMNPLWLPVTHFVDKNDYRVQVYNRWGNLVFETNSDAQAWDGNNAPGDVYAYLITFKNARGEYRELKGSLLLMR